MALGMAVGGGCSGGDGERRGGLLGYISMVLTF